MDLIALYDGTILSTHDVSVCGGWACPVHRPSDHPLNRAQLCWMDDVGVMYRRCGHGGLHPDPDSLFYVMVARGPSVLLLQHHDCDGCCRM